MLREVAQFLRGLKRLTVLRNYIMKQFTSSISETRINLFLFLELPFKNRASYIQDGRTATLQMLHFIYFSANISTEYFKHAAHSPFFSSKCRLVHNVISFGSCIIHILLTECAKI